MKILSVMGKTSEKEQTSGALPNSHYICVTAKTDQATSAFNKITLRKSPVGLKLALT